MSEVRSRRVADQIRQTLAEIVMRELRDPAIGFITITGVELSSDLRYAKAFVSMMGSPAEKSATLAALLKAAPFVTADHDRADHHAIRLCLAAHLVLGSPRN